MLRKKSQTEPVAVHRDRRASIRRGRLRNSHSACLGAYWQLYVGWQHTTCFHQIWYHADSIRDAWRHVLNMEADTLTNTYALELCLDINLFLCPPRFVFLLLFLMMYLFYFCILQSVWQGDKYKDEEWNNFYFSLRCCFVHLNTFKKKVILSFVSSLRDCQKLMLDCWEIWTSVDQTWASLILQCSPCWGDWETNTS